MFLWSAVYVNLVSGKRCKVKKIAFGGFLCHKMKRILFIVINSLYKVYPNAKQFCTLTNIYKTKGESSILCRA